MRDWLTVEVIALLSGLFTWGVTALGSSSVFLFKHAPRRANELMLGFAAGVMTSASFWSLIAPGLEMAEPMGLFKWVPVSVGFLFGAFFLRIIDYLLPHLHPYLKDDSTEGIRVNLKKSTLLFLAITLHNIPEGLSMGVAYGAASVETTGMGFSSALALTVGIGIQNFPEGVAVAYPLRQSGLSKQKSFFYGQLSGAVEPLFALIGVFTVSTLKSLLPYVMGFAAGAMIYVVVEELIPESQSSGETDTSTLGFIIGFLFMMILDVTLS
ncbi:MAG: ZIP family metal transporter [Deltaproteobacteria bacterium]|nr:ZIP family metal transporter [Deltaproteobacteria bacterium]